MPYLNTSSDGEILTVHFTEGKILDALVIQQMQDELLAVLAKADERKVLLDFHAVKFLSSAALGMLVRAHKKCKELKIRMKLCGLVPNIREVFKITGLDKAMEIHADSAEAERAFSK